MDLLFFAGNSEPDASEVLGLPNQSRSMTDSSGSQVYQTFVKNDLRIVCYTMISNLGTIMMIMTEYAE